MKHSWKIAAATPAGQTLHQMKIAVKKKRPEGRALNLQGDLHSPPYLLPQALVSDWEDKIEP